VHADSEPVDVVMRVRQAFEEQARFCAQLGSPFTALLCRVLAEGLDGSSAIERYILEWPGDPSAFADSVPLRVAGALHERVRAGRGGALAPLYPPHPLPSAAALLAAARGVLAEESGFVREFLQFPPQTNEVGRSAALIAGWLEIASRTGLPLSLFEIGSSAGLNLIADRYAYRFGDVPWAPAADAHGGSGLSFAGLTLRCGWTGRRPALDAALRVQSRRGCDRHPLQLADAAQRERLMAYVWADQHERLERLGAAIRALLADPVRVETSDAADWIESVLGPRAAPGVARVVFHSLVWSYLGRPARERIAAHLARIGAAASADRPLAWLRFELAGKDEAAALHLTMWPGGAEELLARAHPHGAWIRWQDEGSGESIPTCAASRG
jgi:hypothetical protein